MAHSRSHHRSKILARKKNQASTFLLDFDFFPKIKNLLEQVVTLHQEDREQSIHSVLIADIVSHPILSAWISAKTDTDHQRFLSETKAWLKQNCSLNDQCKVTPECATYLCIHALTHLILHDEVSSLYYLSEAITHSAVLGFQQILLLSRAYLCIKQQSKEPLFLLKQANQDLQLICGNENQLPGFDECVKRLSSETKSLDHHVKQHKANFIQKTTGSIYITHIREIHNHVLAAEKHAGNGNYIIAYIALTKAENLLLKYQLGSEIFPDPNSFLYMRAAVMAYIYCINYVNEHRLKLKKEIFHEYKVRIVKQEVIECLKDYIHFNSHHLFFVTQAIVKSIELIYLPDQLYQSAKLILSYVEEILSNYSKDTFFTIDAQIKYLKRKIQSESTQNKIQPMGVFDLFSELNRLLPHQDHQIKLQSIVCETNGARNFQEALLDSYQEYFTRQNKEIETNMDFIFICCTKELKYFREYHKSRFTGLFDGLFYLYSMSLLALRDMDGLVNALDEAIYYCVDQEIKYALALLRMACHLHKKEYAAANDYYNWLNHQAEWTKAAFARFQPIFKLDFISQCKELKINPEGHGSEAFLTRQTMDLTSLPFGHPLHVVMLNMLQHRYVAAFENVQALSKLEWSPDEYSYLQYALVKIYLLCLCDESLRKEMKFSTEDCAVLLRHIIQAIMSTATIQFKEWRKLIHYLLNKHSESHEHVIGMLEKLRQLFSDEEYDYHYCMTIDVVLIDLIEKEKELDKQEKSEKHRQKEKTSCQHLQNIKNWNEVIVEKYQPVFKAEFLSNDQSQQAELSAAGENNPVPLSQDSSPLNPYLESIAKPKIESGKKLRNREVHAENVRKKQEMMSQKSAEKEPEEPTEIVLPTQTASTSSEPSLTKNQKKAIKKKLRKRLLEKGKMQSLGLSDLIDDEEIPKVKSPDTVPIVEDEDVVGDYSYPKNFPTPAQRKEQRIEQEKKNKFLEIEKVRANLSDLFLRSRNIFPHLKVLHDVNAELRQQSEAIVEIGGSIAAKFGILLLNADPLKCEKKSSGDIDAYVLMQGVSEFSHVLHVLKKHGFSPKFKQIDDEIKLKEEIISKTYLKMTLTLDNFEIDMTVCSPEYFSFEPNPFLSGRLVFKKEHDVQGMQFIKFNDSVSNQAFFLSLVENKPFEEACKTLTITLHPPCSKTKLYCFRLFKLMNGYDLHFPQRDDDFLQITNLPAIMEESKLYFSTCIKTAVPFRQVNAVYHELRAFFKNNVLGEEKAKKIILLLCHALLSKAKNFATLPIDHMLNLFYDVLMSVKFKFKIPLTVFEPQIDAFVSHFIDDYCYSKLLLGAPVMFIEKMNIILPAVVRVVAAFPESITTTTTVMPSVTTQGIFPAPEKQDVGKQMQGNVVSLRQ